MTANYYDSAEALEQYLLFHYAPPRVLVPYPAAPREAVGYPRRAVELLVDRRRLPRDARALDLGCAVGGSSFALSRWCGEVIGIDLSASFIRAARRIQRQGRYPLTYRIEGDRRASIELIRPSATRAERVRFLVGDAMCLDARLGAFDVAVLLNLIDRVPDPAAMLHRLTRHLRPGAQLVIASPYTWMTAYTPRAKWLGGRPGSSTLEALHSLLNPSFRLIRRKQIPFIIREHARKFQWSMAEGTTWVRRAN